MINQAEYAQLASISFEAGELTFSELCSEEVKSIYTMLPDEQAKFEFAEKLRDRALALKRKGDFEKWWKTVTKIKPRISTTTNMLDLPISDLEFGPYGITESGLYYYDERKGEITFAEGTPLIVTKILHNIDGEPNKVELAYKLRGEWRRVIVRRRDVNDSRAILDLANYEINVNSANAGMLVEYISRFIALNTERIPIEKSVGRLGWYGDEFIPYGTNYTFDGAQNDRSKFDAVRAHGDYNEWLKAYKQVCAVPIVRFYMAASFASVLLKRLEGQMFVVHIWGDTETGKTVAQLMAMSAWGEPWRLVSTFNATKVWAERQAAFLGNIPFALNELQTIKDRWTNTDQLIYQLCEGQSRGRGSKGGGNDEMKYWRMVILSNGEQCITDDNTLSGAANRVIELETKFNLFDDAPGLCDTIRDNYGHAGQKFVDAVQKFDVAELKTIYNVIRKEIASADMMDKQNNSLAFVFLADCIANQIFNGMTPNEAFDSSVDLLQALKKSLPNKKDITIFERSYDNFTSWVMQNKSKFTDSDYNECYGIIESDNGSSWVYILPTALDVWCQQSGFVKKMILSTFLDNGVLEANPSNKDRVTKRIKNNPCKTYKIKLS